MAGPSAKEKMEEFCIEEENEAGMGLTGYLWGWVHVTWSKVVVRVNRRDTSYHPGYHMGELGVTQ